MKAISVKLLLKKKKLMLARLVKLVQLYIVSSLEISIILFYSKFAYMF